MRLLLHHLVLGVLAALTLTGCNGEAPPGRWQGVIFDGHVIIAVRLEVQSGNLIRTSAPNLRADFARMNPGERIHAFKSVEAQLVRTWETVQPGKVEMSGGHITRKNGYATLFEYDESAGTMTFYFYGDGTLTHKVPMARVAEFGPLPVPKGL